MKKFLLSAVAAAFILPFSSAQASIDNDAFLDAEKKVRYGSYQDFIEALKGLDHPRQP
jgi:soluble lytic murein transglycosylase